MINAPRHTCRLFFLEFAIVLVLQVRNHKLLMIAVVAEHGGVHLVVRYVAFPNHAYAQ